MSIVEQAPHCGSFFSETPTHIFTPEQFHGEERLMIETAEQFSRKEVLPLSERLDEKEPGLMPGLIHKAGELGLCGVDTAEAYGGLGLGKNLSARILEYLSMNGSFSVTFGVSSGIGQLGISLFGTEAQKQKYLPLVSSGRWIGAYALSEPNSGSDALSATTRADFKNGRWILNGTKMWISNAAWADVFIVMAKVDGDKFSAFIVERDYPGVSIGREEHKLGLKGSSTAKLILEDAEVPEENLLHQIGLGHQVALNSLNIGRFKLGAMSLGPARDALRLAAKYALDRKQFGRPIAEFGLIRKKFAESAARYYAGESMLYRTGALIDAAFAEFGGTIDGNKKAAEEYAIECSACKVFCSEAEAFIVDEMLQVFGGYGFTEEFPIARHYRDARVSRIYEGTNEINRVFLAERLRRKANDGKASLVASGDSFISELAGVAFKRVPEHQVVLGAMSDLLLLSYAEQSARKRAEQVKGNAAMLYPIFLNWANGQAALAFQMATGEEVKIPAPEHTDIDAAALAVYEKRGPLSS
ncbi:MAG TPA: acyl-CoA dehydrogenase family protein [Fimbriimonadaceae bacterium]|jgi:alkylation response protein AidB-like acyl-CoA dehydrogenase